MTPLSAHVRACAVVVVDRRLSRVLHYIFGRYGSNTYFSLLSSIHGWRSMKFWSVHLPVVIHYSTGTTTNSASLVLKRVRIRCARRCCCKVFSGRRVYLPPYSPIIPLELPPCRWKGCREVFSGKPRRKNAVVLAAEVVDSLLWVERHSGTVTGLPPKERLQKRIYWSLQLLFLWQYVHCLSFQPCWRIEPSYDHVSNGRNTVTFELILLQTQRRSINA